jgi:hypothetical protein
MANDILCDSYQDRSDELTRPTECTINSFFKKNLRFANLYLQWHCVVGHPTVILVTYVDI